MIQTTHTHTHTHTHTNTHMDPINGHKFDLWQAWHLHPWGLWSLCFSWPLLMQHTLMYSHTNTHTHTHTYRQALFPLSLPSFTPFLPLTHLSRTLLTPDPAPLGTVIDFSSDPLNLGWRRVRTGELVAIVRYNGGDAEDEGERSMRADGWACSSRKQQSAMEKIKKAWGKMWEQHEWGWERGDGGGWREVFFVVLSSLVLYRVCTDSKE